MIILVLVNQHKQAVSFNTLCSWFKYFSWYTSILHISIFNDKLNQLSAFQSTALFWPLGNLIRSSPKATCVFNCSVISSDPIKWTFENAFYLNAILIQCGQFTKSVFYISYTFVFIFIFIIRILNLRLFVGKPVRNYLIDDWVIYNFSFYS